MKAFAHIRVRSDEKMNDTIEIRRVCGCGGYNACIKQMYNGAAGLVSERGTFFTICEPSERRTAQDRRQKRDKYGRKAAKTQCFLKKRLAFEECMCYNPLC